MRRAPYKLYPAALLNKPSPSHQGSNLISYFGPNVLWLLHYWLLPCCVFIVARQRVISTFCSRSETLGGKSNEDPVYLQVFEATGFRQAVCLHPVSNVRQSQSSALIPARLVRPALQENEPTSRAELRIKLALPLAALSHCCLFKQPALYVGFIVLNVRVNSAV